MDLNADRMPTQWRNVLSDIGQWMVSPLNPATGKPIGTEARACRAQARTVHDGAAKI